MNAAVITKLRPPLLDAGLLLNESVYEAYGVGDDLSLAQIAEFNSLIAKSQQHLTPIYALSAEQLAGAGAVQENWEESRDNFNQQFETLATKITGMVESTQGVISAQA